MIDFKCRICGNNEYGLLSTSPILYYCYGCGSAFVNKNLFSVERELKIEYLDNYDLENFGEMNYKHLYDSGVDLRAAIENPITIHPYVDVKYMTGGDPFVKIPFGIKIQPSHSDMDVKIYNRSGLSSKHGVSIRNAVGIIDAGYTGECVGFFKNTSERPYTIKPGERVAQMVVEKRLDVKIIKVSSIDGTERGEGGFGSTGKN